MTAMVKVGGNFVRVWTEAEESWLRANAKTKTLAEMAAHLGRSWRSVSNRTSRLGLLKLRRWTREDDMRLRSMWGSKSVRYVAAKLDRTVATTYWRAQLLGLDLGLQPGTEYLKSAAKRAGFSPEALRNILSWARVHTSLPPTRTTSKRPKRCIEPDVVDDAVARWMKTETLAAAARRYGFSESGSVLLRLRASGLPLPKKPKRLRHWRIPSETIDKAMAMVELRGNKLVRVTNERTERDG
jgi:hypothetical protein